MKFAHIADCHLGSWGRRPELQELNLKSFEYAIDKCLKERVSLIVIAGDFFDISFPTSTNVLSRVFKKLKEAREKGVAIYLIPGSHDFSASGESMLKVCEAAGLCKNLMGLLHDSSENEKIKLDVFKDEKLNVLITGVLGKRVGLEMDILKRLDREHLKKNVENKSDSSTLKIFLVHTAISELMPAKMNNEMETINISDLPEGFDYYAVGHIHEPKVLEKDKKIFAYSGCLFPNNFSELSTIKHGNFIIAEFNDGKIRVNREIIKLKDVVHVFVDAEGKEARGVEEELFKKIAAEDLQEKILTLKVSGTLKKGKISDISFDQLYNLVKEKGCFCFLRNTHGLATKEFEVEVSKAESVEEIEKEIIERALKDLGPEDRKNKERMIHSLIKILDKESQEDEKKDEFSSRLVREIIKSLKIEDKFE